MFGKKSYIKKLLFLSSVTLLFLIPLLAIRPSCQSPSDLKKETFFRLNKIRIEKKQKVIKYFRTVRKLALEMQTDDKMLHFFTKMKKMNKGDINNEYALDEHAIINYGQFYDILFVDNNGFIFHSLKKESDYCTNIFSGRMAGTRISTGIQQKENFVEYDFYSPSGEPAAFFAITVSKSNVPLGWIVLQCAINRLNTILTDRKSLGRTGEVYLVNKNKMMLSDSRFIDDSTILKLKVDTEAVKRSLKNKSGECIIEDYRGTRVFSSFEKFDLFGTSWIIITEIDENEVLTDHYKKNKKRFNKEIADYIAGRIVKRKTAKEIYSSKRIDINEFAKAEPGETLQTFGVATCTAVTIFNKNKFCYLSHISPTDNIYNKKRFRNILFKSDKGGFLRELIGKVKYFDLYPFELRELEFVIIAPHVNSFSNTVDEILNNGMELSNIKFMYNPAARCANVTADVTTNTAIVKWVSDNARIVEFSSDVEDLSTILKKIIKYDT